MSGIQAQAVQVQARTYTVIPISWTGPAAPLVLVSSRSRPGAWHRLTLSGYEWVCECQAYHWRGCCAHTEAARLYQLGYWQQQRPAVAVAEVE